MQNITTFRLILLRATYGIIAIGLIFVAWPELLYPNIRITNPNSVVQSFLAAMSLSALMGIAHPIKMLPVLLFEFTWKCLWVIFYGLPAMINGSINQYGNEVLIACAFGVILVFIALPWRYLISHYLLTKTEVWRNNSAR